MTDRYAMFGNPLSHTKSPLIHMTFARDTGEDIDYGKIEAPLNAFGASVETFRAAGGRGINITAPFKLEAHQLSVMDVVRSVNESNLILPAGDVKTGPYDYNLYTNSQLKGIDEINSLPLKTVDGTSVLVGDVGVEGP